MWLAECLPLLLLQVYIRYYCRFISGSKGVVSRVSTSVNTVSAYHIARRG